jgi:hypothetical protein
MPDLNSEQLSELADHFVVIANVIGDYRTEHFSSLTQSQREELQTYHSALLNYIDELSAESTCLSINQPSLDKLKNVVTEINQTNKNLLEVQKIIDVAAAGVALAEAVCTKNPKEIADTISRFSDSWKNNNLST